MGEPTPDSPTERVVAQAALSRALGSRASYHDRQRSAHIAQRSWCTELECVFGYGINDSGRDPARAAILVRLLAIHGTNRSRDREPKRIEGGISGSRTRATPYPAPSAVLKSPMEWACGAVLLTCLACRRANDVNWQVTRTLAINTRIGGLKRS